MWSFIREVEPQTFLAARCNGELVGYAIFVPSLKRLQRKALLSGAVFRWIADALAGGFAIRLSAVPRVLMNKLLFARSGARYRRAGDAQLLNVAVEPRVQGKGVATALMRAGKDALRAMNVPEVRLEVRPWNRSALALYEKTGWREVARTRDLEGEWIVMTANLS